jgi:ankyrin repeat protein
MCKYQDDQGHEHHDFVDDKDSMYIPKMLVEAGADINFVTDYGLTALSQAIKLHNNKLAEFLLKKGANIYNHDPALLDAGPLFRAIEENNMTAIEMLCDHGADLTVKNQSGQTPMIFSAKNKYDDICMYLSLRTKDINEEDEHGLNAVFIMIQRNELDRCKQLLRRGANINYENKKGTTAIHFAIDNRLPEKTVRFLIDFGANIHFEDQEGLDTCDKVKKENLYPKIKQFYDNACITDPSLRNQRTN